MKRFKNSVLGVTLLEVMLVLAIVAVIIVLSIRYYQSASATQQANGGIQTIQAIVAASDNLSTPTGSYSGTVSQTSLTGLLGTNGLALPWGATANVTAASATTLSIGMGTVPTAVCNIIIANFQGNTKYNVPAGCATVTYNKSG